MPEPYTIGSGLSEQELALASWWVRHGIGLKRVGYGALAGLSLCLWGFTTWSVVDAYLISEPRESRIIQHIVQQGIAMEALNTATPQPLLPSDVTVAAGTDGRQDVLVQLSNVNAQWWAEFDYLFDSNGQRSATRTSYILPEQQRYLTELGWSDTNGVLQPQLSLLEVRWHRLQPKTVEHDYKAFFQKRFQLTFDEITYKKDLIIGNQSVGQTTFLLHNPSGYGFWSTDLTIILYRLDTKIAFTTINIKELRPGETRPITVNWFENLSSITKTEVYADVNVLNPTVYLPGQRF